MKGEGGCMKVILVLGVLAASTIYAAATHPRPASTPVTKNFCKTLRTEGEQQCQGEMENMFMDQGGDNYTRGVRMKDMVPCRRIGEAVQNACVNNYGKE